MRNHVTLSAVRIIIELGPNPMGHSEGSTNVPPALVSQKVPQAVTAGIGEHWPNPALEAEEQAGEKCVQRLLVLQPFWVIVASVLGCVAS